MLMQARVGAIADAEKPSTRRVHKTQSIASQASIIRLMEPEYRGTRNVVSAISSTLAHIDHHLPEHTSGREKQQALLPGVLAATPTCTCLL
jgi:hypothetical protein